MLKASLKKSPFIMAVMTSQRSCMKLCMQQVIFLSRFKYAMDKKIMGCPYRMFQQSVRGLHAGLQCDLQYMVCRGVNSFSTNCRLPWLAFISTYPENCIHGQYAVTSPTLLALNISFFQGTPTTHNLFQTVDRSKQKFVVPGLQVYGLATPLIEVVVLLQYQ